MKQNKIESDKKEKIMYNKNENLIIKMINTN